MRGTARNPASGAAAAGHRNEGDFRMRKSGVATLLIAGAAALMFQYYSEDTSCHGRIRPGPNSNTSRLDTTLDIPDGEWPAFAGILRDFAAKRGWSVREGVGKTDSSFRWLDTCDDRVTTIVPVPLAQARAGAVD